jgi:hypothetical protein
MPLPFWTIGCVYGAASVTLGAFGAHGLKKRIADPSRLANWNTAAQYQVRLSSLLPTITLAHLKPLAHTLWDPPARDFSCAQEHPRCELACGWHDNVQREHIFVGAGSAEVQGVGTYHAARWSLPNWRLGCVGVWEAGTFPKMIAFLPM